MAPPLTEEEFSMSDHHQHGDLLVRPPKRDQPDRGRTAAPRPEQGAPAQPAKKPVSVLDRFIDRFFRLH